MTTKAARSNRAAIAKGPENGLTRVAEVEDLRKRGVVTVTERGKVVAVFWHEGRTFAVDNRCPHMGFPLSRGTCKDGMLTCGWHYARFDLESGGTFDPFAGDVTAYPTSIVDGAVWVDLRDRNGEVDAGKLEGRLREGLEQDIRLVSAKTVLALTSAGIPDAVRRIVAACAAHGLARGSGRNALGWGDGLTILTAMANIQADLAPEDRSLALYHGARRVSEDTANQMALVDLRPLPNGKIAKARLKEWFREFIEVRNDQAAERVLRTAIAGGWQPAELIDLFAAASTDHYFRDFSHVMDTVAKAAELLDLIGWERAADVLPALIDQLAGSTREEEGNQWRHPDDLVGLVEAAVAELGGAVDLAARPRSAWRDSLVERLLEEDPALIVQAVMEAFRDGQALADVAQAVAVASALRIARFPTSNEFGDWDTALHHFSYCAALTQVARKAPSVELARGVLHGAMLVYQARFLNVPIASLPGNSALAKLPSAPQVLLDELSGLFDRQGGVDEAGALTYRYLTLDHDPRALVRVLGNAVLREDPGFHDFQTLEQGIRLFKDLDQDGRTEAGRQVLVAIARWQAAHSPTRRATTQTYDIALRLHRGEAIYAAEAVAAP